MTYKEIQEKYKKRYGKTIKTCWIAEIKRRNGHNVRLAYNRIDKKNPKHPCPADIAEKLAKIVG